MSSDAVLCFFSVPATMFSWLIHNEWKVFMWKNKYGSSHLCFYWIFSILSWEDVHKKREWICWYLAGIYLWGWSHFLSCFHFYFHVFLWPYQIVCFLGQRLVYIYYLSAGYVTVWPWFQLDMLDDNGMLIIIHKQAQVMEYVCLLSFWKRAWRSNLGLCIYET